MKSKHLGLMLITLPILMGAAIALVLPLEAASDSFARRPIELARIIFPTVEKMKGGYALAGIALLYFSTIWLLTPLTVIGWYLYIEDQKHAVLTSCKANKWSSSFFACLFFPAITALTLAANFESTVATDVRTYLTYHTRLGLAAMGFWIPLGVSMFSAICIFWWTHIHQIFEGDAQ